MNKTTDNINQTYEQLKARNEAMADLEHANLANIINRMSDHLENVIAQRDAAVAALRAGIAALEAYGTESPALRQMRAAIAATQGSAQ